MSIYSLPPDMQQDVKKLAQEHSVTINEAYDYYLMGGYKHAEYLCSLRDRGVPDELIRMINQEIWDKKNKEIRDELEKRKHIDL